MLDADTRVDARCDGENFMDELKQYTSQHIAKRSNVAVIYAGTQTFSVGGFNSTFCSYAGKTETWYSNFYSPLMVDGKWRMVSLVHAIQAHESADFGLYGQIIAESIPSSKIQPMPDRRTIPGPVSAKRNPSPESSIIRKKKTPGPAASASAHRTIRLDTESDVMIMSPEYPPPSPAVTPRALTSAVPTPAATPAATPPSTPTGDLAKMLADMQEQLVEMRRKMEAQDAELAEYKKKELLAKKREMVIAKFGMDSEKVARAVSAARTLFNETIEQYSDINGDVRTVAKDIPPVQAIMTRVSDRVIEAVSTGLHELDTELADFEEVFGSID